MSSLVTRVTELFMMAAPRDTDGAENEEDMGTCTLEEPLEDEDCSEDDGADY